jgi:hypothetical protein
MRYFMTIIIDPKTDSGDTPPPEALMDAMGPHVEREIASGRLISTGGLKRSNEGTRITGHTGKLATKDGPFTEAKEVIGGYAVLEVPDKAAAITAASDFVKLHVNNGMPNITVEVRPIEGGYNY